MNVGDIVKIHDDFEGSVIVQGWSGQENIEDLIFEVVDFSEYRRAQPSFAQIVRAKPSAQGEVFLKHGSEIFVLSPAKALDVVRKAAPVCNCSITRLWAGNGHAKNCPEFP
jgi:hypothetical protein